MARVFQPMNPHLYARLKAVFTHVNVAQPGAKFEPYWELSPLRERPTLKKKFTCEHYCVNCPFCNDMKRRLCVNYRWGTVFEGGSDIPAMHLIDCKNENCLADWDNYRFFRALLDSAVAVAPLGTGLREEAAEEQKPPEWPGECIMLGDLPPTDPAVAYMAGRGFDPVVLTKAYGVRVCRKVASRYRKYARFIQDQLIFPVFADRRMVGWQARPPLDLPWKDPILKKTLPPKYFTCPGMQRSNYAANFDSASRYRSLAVVEGWTDVFSFGPPSICLLSKRVSSRHREILAAYAAAPDVAGIAFMIDPEEFDDVRQATYIAELNEACHGKVAAVRLPDGTDPGSLERGFVRRYAVARAAEQGLHLDFSPRAGRG